MIEPEVDIKELSKSNPTVRTVDGVEYIHYADTLIDLTTCGVMMSHTGQAHAVFMGKIFVGPRPEPHHFQVLSEVAAPTFSAMLSFFSDRLYTWHIHERIYGALNESEKAFLQSWSRQQRENRRNPVEIIIPANVFQDGTRIGFYSMLMRQALEQGRLFMPDDSRIRAALAQMSEDNLYKDDCRDHSLIAATGFALEASKSLWPERMQGQLRGNRMNVRSIRTEGFSGHFIKWNPRR